MKKIGTYLRNLPTGVKWIVGINISIYIMTIFIFSVFNIRLQNYLGAYPTYSDNFNPLQLLSSMFTHAIGFDHIFFNMILFLIFAPFVERSFGTKLFVLTYLVCGLLGYVFTNYTYHENKLVIENSITKSGINIDDIRLSNFNVDDNYLSTLTSDQSIEVTKYNRVISKTYGASSSLFGMILIYILLNFKTLRKLPYVVLGLYLIYETINRSTQIDPLLSGSDYSHIGGMVGGLILYITYKTKKGIN